MYNDGHTLAQIARKLKLHSSSSAGYWVVKGRDQGLITQVRGTGYRPPAAITKKGAHTNGAGPVTGTHEREEIDSGSQADQKLQNHISYCFGHTEAWLEAYCNGAGISKSNVTRELANLLHRTARR